VAEWLFLIASASGSGFVRYLVIMAPAPYVALRYSDRRSSPSNGDVSIAKVAR
jgi:hypothetical protein